MTTYLFRREKCEVILEFGLKQPWTPTKTTPIQPLYGWQVGETKTYESKLFGKVADKLLWLFLPLNGPLQ
jgi:hypothetical protein